MWVCFPAQVQMNSLYSLLVTLFLLATEMLDQSMEGTTPIYVVCMHIMSG